MEQLYGFGFLVQLGGFQEVVEFAAEIRTKAVHADEPRLVRGLRAFLQDQQVTHREIAAGAGCRLLGTEGLRHTAFFHTYFLHSHLSQSLSLIHISEPTRQAEISYADSCL